MAEKIYRPTVGPTSSRERADALDATVPNPDEICLPQSNEIEWQMSTWIYPVVSEDAYDVNISLEYAQNYSWNPLEYDVSINFISGVLTKVVDWTYYTYRNTASVTPEEYDVSFSFVYGDLRVVSGYVYHTQPPEEYDANITFVSGVLTVI